MGVYKKTVERWQIANEIDEMDPLETIFSLYLHNLSLIVLKDMELINKDWNELSKFELRYLTLRMKQYGPKELARLTKKAGQEKRPMDFTELLMRKMREPEDVAPPTSSADENF
mgnify:CR=1 FL=1